MVYYKIFANNSKELHATVIRQNLDLYQGYEASFVNHSFTTTFANLENALNFVIATQVSLLHVEWPAALLATDLYVLLPLPHSFVYDFLFQR